MKIEIIDTPNAKAVRSSEYNMYFRKFDSRGEPDGFMARWGKTKEDDPQLAPAPEIADVEISSGNCSSNCPWCYKSNSPNKPIQNMDFETYKKVLDKLSNPGILTQVALGLTTIDANPDLLKIMRYTRDKGILPNFTISGGDRTLTLDLASQLADLCGALAVSVTPWNQREAFRMIDLFSSLGVRQTNCHLVLSEESIPFIRSVMKAKQEEDILSGLNAIVLLMLKPKGRARGYLPPTREQFEELVHDALKAEIPLGFDSCSCPHFIRSLDSMDVPPSQKKGMIQNSDPCESMICSIYCNVNGSIYPCSFAEGKPGYEPISLLETEDFLRDVWHSDMAKLFRRKLWTNGRRCPIFPEVAELRSR